MTFPATLLLGLIAGITILIGLPIGRIRSITPMTRVLLNALAVGVLVFLLWDVLSHAWEPIDGALSTGKEPAVLALDGTLFVLGTAGSLIAITLYERRFARHGGSDDATLDGRRLAVLIAIGIGVHNFAEGLAIGQSAGSGQIGFAVALVIGFALHNGTEGFGIVAPMAAAGGPAPSWRFLLALGAIGGGPTVLGTAIGFAFASSALSVLFLALAAGSILYVVAQLLGLAARARRSDLVAFGLTGGLMAGFVTDAILTAAGA